MPDYSNTIIYKIYCKDETIKDVYIGHTTNFLQRKNQHKNYVNNNENVKLYNFISKNGGWDNWEMIEIGKYNCNNAKEARIKEQEHFMQENSTLNSCMPCKYKNNLLNDKNSNNPNDKSSFLCECVIKCICNQSFLCKKCDFECRKKYSWERHLLTRKHLSATHLETNKENIVGILKKNLYSCEYCDKIYSSRNGLWKHKKICNTNNEYNNKIIEKDELIQFLMNENKELKQVIMDVIKTTAYNKNNCDNETLN